MYIEQLNLRKHHDSTNISTIATRVLGPLARPVVVRLLPLFHDMLCCLLPPSVHLVLASTPQHPCACLGRCADTRGYRSIFQCIRDHSQ